MIIKKIKILKNIVKITFDNSSILELDKETYTNFYLYEGKDVSKSEYKSIKELNDTSKLLQYALKIRSKAVYSEYSLREKLYNKEANKGQVDKIIKILKSYDLIDDKAYASDLLEYYNSLNYGENKIRNKLLEKGIFQKEIDKLSFPVSKERSKAKALLPKLEKKYSKYNDSQKKSHIYNAYISLGFNGDIASEMVGLVKSTSSKDELDKLRKDYLKAKTRLERKYKGKELKQKILSSLAQKGYKYNDILKVMN